ncbi:MAG: TrbI/VirB10 family protein [Hyphomonadaceae bacterium]|nr:TrbI/VirB10 family protein [Hyphomonadaceae bacterium]
MKLASAAAAPQAEAPDVAIRARPPSPKRLSRKVLLAGTLGIGGVVAFALVSGLSERPDRIRAGEAEAVTAAAGPPESIRSASAQYDVADLPRAESTGERDMLWGEHAPPAEAELAPPEDQTWASQVTPVRAERGEAPPDPQAVARTSPILFGEARRSDAALAGDGMHIGAGGDRAAFLASQRGEGDERLTSSLTPMRSAYEILAGSVIPAALATELNSDLPGRVIAQVTAPVYDSVTGDHLLIPQGARLIGTYDSATTHGDRRVLLVWNRLIMPNGYSINLQGMEAVDPAGAAGLRDRVDNHLTGLAGAIGLSAIISVVANEAEDDDPDSFGQSVGDAAAQEAARVGGRIVDRNLAIRPTLRVRPGAPVRVLVTRDIRLRPYRG